MKAYLAAAGLLVMIFGSAFHLVLLRHESKALFGELRSLRKQEDELERMWSQLLLEQGTQNEHGRVERVAREKLGMTLPAPSEIVRVPL